MPINNELYNRGFGVSSKRVVGVRQALPIHGPRITHQGECPPECIFLLASHGHSRTPCVSCRGLAKCETKQLIRLPHYAGQSLQPVLNFQVLDATEVFDVPRYYNEVSREANGSYH